MFVSVALGLAVSLAANIVRIAWPWWPLTVWTAVALLALATVAIERARSRPTVERRAVKRALATFVEDQQRWARKAAAQRHELQPDALHVRWASTARPVAAARDVVLDEPAEPGWSERPLEGDARGIMAAFRRLPHRQLVVLGEAGGGKTILATLLSQDLLKNALPGEPVPALLPIASWNPGLEPALDFVIRRLGEEHEFLSARTSDGRSMAEVLVEGGKVLPVLDGLDELPADLHSEAIEALDRFAAADRPLVVTCRTHDYEQAVQRGGFVLSRAAVVEIKPVDITQAIAFLSHPYPSLSRWQPVFEHLGKYPVGPLAQALSTPLMVALARTAYHIPDTNPADLIKFADSEAIAESLIDGFVTSVYRPDRPAHPPSRTLRRQRPHTDDPDRAARWLSYLAYHMYELGTRDLWWWQLSPALLSSSPALASFFVPALTTLAAVAGGLGIGLAFGAPAAWSAVLAGVIVGASAGGVFRSLWPSSYLPHVILRYRSVRLHRVRRAGVQVAFGVTFGLITGLLVNAPLLGLAGGLLCGLAALVMPTVSVQVGARRSTPRSTVRANYRNVAAGAAQYGLVGGLLFATLARIVPGSPDPLIAGRAAALAYGLAAAYSAGLWTWTRYRLIHMSLAAQGRLPWRLWTFLDDAHRREVLRQAGTAWQFRHAVLQDHLARAMLQRLNGALIPDRVHIGHIDAEGLLVGTPNHVFELRTRADAGDQHAAQELANLLAGEERIDELRARADANDEYAAKELGNLLIAKGRVAELRGRADSGDRYAGARLADLLAGQQRVDELRARADAGDRHAAAWLANLLARRDRVDELQSRAETGDLHAAGWLANLYLAQHRIDDAIAVLLPCIDHNASRADRSLAIPYDAWKRLNDAGRASQPDAETGHLYAAIQLADFLDAQGRIEDAIAILQPYVASFTADPVANELLSFMLVKQGRIEAAIAILWLHPDDLDAARRMATILEVCGRFDEAAPILWTRAESSDSHSAKRLASLLNTDSRVSRAIRILWPHANRGDLDTAAHMAAWYFMQDRMDEATAVLRTRADAGDAPAAERLADLLICCGRFEDAIAILWPRADDRDAAKHLADLLDAKDNRLNYVIQTYRDRADAGDPDAAERLAELFYADDRIDDLRARADLGDRFAARLLAW